MPRSVSLPALQAMLAQHTSAVFLELLTIDHADLASPIRIVNNTESVVSDANTFDPFPFKVTLPQDVEDSEPVARLTISNVDQSIITALRTVTSAPTFTLAVVLSDSPSTKEYGPIDLELRDYQVTKDTISLNLAMTNLSQEPYPYLNFDPVNFPGLF